MTGDGHPTPAELENELMNNPYTVHTLDNGLRIVIERMPHVCSAAAGFLVRTGARDDTAPLAGVAHFLEHMMFKGTSKRSWREITVDFDRMGSSYNAFTSEDRTIYYGWVRRADIKKQIELLADMMRSKIPSEEFETEKKVVLEEIAMAKDSLDHVAFDFLQEKVFADHPLGWPILGYEETVRSMTRDAMWDYFQKAYGPGNLILVVAGNVEPTEVIEATETYCGQWPATEGGPARTAPELRRGTDSMQIERFNQQVVALTFPSVSACDERCESAATAAAILGGENSRFFWNIVQKGMAPRAGAYHMDYTDCGAMILYATCQPENAERLVDAMRVEASDICKNDVSQKEIERVKNRHLTSLAIETEVPYHRLMHLMDDMEYHGEPRTVDQMLAEINAVSAESIHSYFAAYPIKDGGHLTSVGPRRWPEVA